MSCCTWKVISSYSVCFLDFEETISSIKVEPFLAMALQNILKMLTICAFLALEILADDEVSCGVSTVSTWDTESDDSPSMNTFERRTLVQSVSAQTH